MAQYDSYRSKNIRNTQDRGGSEKARFSQSDTLLYQQHLSRPDIPMPRGWKSATGQNWTHWPPPHPQGQRNRTSSSSSKKLWSSSETIDEQHLQRKQPEYRCRQHDNISMELVEECVKRRLRRCYRNCHASIGHRRSWRSNETCQ